MLNRCDKRHALTEALRGGETGVTRNAGRTWEPRRIAIPYGRRANRQLVV